LTVARNASPAWHPGQIDRLNDLQLIVEKMSKETDRGRANRQTEPVCRAEVQSITRDRRASALREVLEG
jgi:hypothetical protein